VGARTARARAQSLLAFTLNWCISRRVVNQYNDSNPAFRRRWCARWTGRGHLDGYGYYIEAFAWVLERRYDRNPGHRGGATHTAVCAFVRSQWGLMLAAKYDHVKFDVTGLPTAAGGALDPAQGSYRVDAFELGAMVGSTNNIRVTGNYVMNYFTGDART